MLTLGEKIRVVRKEKGMSQENLAKLIGKTKNVISNWERGDNKPDAQMIETLCTVLNISPNYLLNWSNSASTLHKVIDHFQEKEFTDDELEDITDFIKYILIKRINKNKF